MEYILQQSFDYAEISLLKNYVSLQEKDDFIDAINTDRRAITNNSDAESILHPFTMKAVCHPQIPVTYPKFIKLYPKDNNRKFFYTDSPNDGDERSKFERVFLSAIESRKGDTKNLILPIHKFTTRKSRHIKKHYNNPFSQIEITKIERAIKKDDDIITVKLFVSIKKRTFNSIYFIKSVSSQTITFNLKTGNFLVTNYNKVRKVERKSFYSNSILSLDQSLKSVFNASSKIGNSHLLYGQFMKEFDDTLFEYALVSTFNFKELQEKCLKHPHAVKDVADAFIKEWSKRFAELRKIKMPNHGFRLLKFYYPTEKYLKKNDRKLIAAVLDRLNCKSKITIKLLHEYPQLDLLLLDRLRVIFGKNYPKYIGNICDSFFEKWKDKSETYSRAILFDEDNRMKELDISNSEKENVIKIINNYETGRIERAIREDEYLHLITSLTDHFNMLERVREYYPDIQLRATTYDTFHEEHSQLSAIERLIKKKWTIEYVFDENLIHHIEEPIVIHRLNEMPPPSQPYGDFKYTTDVYNPKILTNSEEYLEEGAYMHHCVAGYINTETSIIISLRFKNKERVTCEYDNRTRRCIQSRFFSNQTPPEHYKEALELLTQRVKTYPFKLAPIDKVKRPIIINGKEVKITEEDVFGYLIEQPPIARILPPQVNFNLNNDINEIMNHPIQNIGDIF